MGRWLRCELNGDKAYDKFVRACYFDGQNISATVIANGLALDCPRYSGARYTEYEIEGAAAKVKLLKYCR